MDISKAASQMANLRIKKMTPQALVEHMKMMTDKRMEKRKKLQKESLASIVAKRQTENL